jgi:hypothetical protein
MISPVLFALLALVTLAYAASTTAEHAALLRQQFKGCTEKIPGHISAWSQVDLGACLEMCGLSNNITKTFMDQDIDGDGFLTVTDNDLVQLFVSRVDLVRFRLMVWRCTLLYVTFMHLSDDADPRLCGSSTVISSLCTRVLTY